MKFNQRIKMKFYLADQLINISGRTSQYRYDEFDPLIASQRVYWLTMLHLSGLFVFLFPSLIIWFSKKDQIEEIRDHGRDVINIKPKLNHNTSHVNNM
jgi:hypothetical protein